MPGVVGRAVVVELVMEVVVEVAWTLMIVLRNWALERRTFKRTNA
jgi:hypothetical protein